MYNIYPSLIEIGSKTAEKKSAQTNNQTDKPTDTTKIMALGREPTAWHVRAALRFVPV